MLCLFQSKMVNQERICRLCLQICDDFKVIEANTKEILNINLAVSEDPVMCMNCEEIVKRCFDFKAICRYTQECIQPFIDSGENEKLDLRDAYQSKNENVNAICDGDNVCRLCMGLLKSSSIISLDNKEEEVTVEKMMVEKCLPELDLGVTKKPVICASCHGSLQKYFSFVMNCAILEEDIKKYCDAAGTGLIKLEEVPRFAAKNKCKEDGNKMGRAGMADYKNEHVEMEDQKFTKELLRFSSKLSDEDCYKIHFVKIEEALREKKDEVEIKQESFVKKECQKFNDMLQFPSKDVVNLKEVDTKVDIIKTEKTYCMEKGNEVEDMNGEFEETQERKFLFRNDGDVEIKTDQQEYSFQNNDAETSEMTLHCCEFCSFETKCEQFFKKHLLVHKNSSEVKMYGCDSCSFQSKYKQHLKRHFLIHKDPSEVTMYQCDSCSFQTKYKVALVGHASSHKDPSEVTMYRCDSCTYQAKQKNSLRIHLLTHKNPSDISMYQCDYCSFRTKYKQHLKTHLLTHKSPAEIKMHQCEFCSFQTKYKSNLVKHRLAHDSSSEIVMFWCNSCSFQTKHKSGLAVHMLTHKDPAKIKMHRCDYCSFQTKYKQHLRAHALTHKDPSEVPMYQCQYCSHQTKNKQHMRRHLVTHKSPSAVEMSLCEYCSYQTKHKQNLRRHLLIHKNVRK